MKDDTKRSRNGPSTARNGTNSSELKSALWEAANTLRGSAVDRTDWKGYILPLLFFKRISDVWDEETAEAQEMYGEANPSLFPENHRFVLPEGCHWNDVREVATNVGAALRRAMQEVERANPDTLFRVFGNADWGDKEKFSDELLKDLTEGFSGIRLGNSEASTDILGDAYEYLVGKFADVTRRNKAGEFYTPRSVVRMMVEILDPQEGESIYDPACGTGGMLLGAIEHVVRKGGDPRTFYGKIYGQEKNLTTSGIARMNLVLHGIEDFQIAREDTLRSPTFTDASTGGLRNRQSTLLPEGVGPGAVGSRPVVTRRVRNSSGELRRLRVRTAHDCVDGRDRKQPHGCCPAAGGAVPEVCRRKNPRGVAQKRPDRGRHRPWAEPVLRHPARRLRRHTSAEETRGQKEEGPHHRRLKPLPQRAGPKLPRPGAQ